MITEQKIRTYISYNGDIDAWARAASMTNIENEDWYIIENLIQDLVMMEHDVVADKYKHEVENKLAKQCADEHTIALMKAFAQKQSSI
ncbi:MAG TPA: hypothetical protein VGD89_04835 [Flavipsychrobacter sp.]